MTNSKSNISHLENLINYLSYTQFHLQQSDKSAVVLTETIKHLPQYSDDLYIMDKVRGYIADCNLLLESLDAISDSR